MKRAIVIGLISSLLLGGYTYFGNIKDDDSEISDIKIDKEDNTIYENGNSENEGINDSISIVEDDAKDITEPKDKHQEGDTSIIKDNDDKKDNNNSETTEKMNKSDSNKETNKDTSKVAEKIIIEEVRDENEKDIKEEKKESVLAISEDKIDNVEGSLSLSDKAKAMKLIITKLNPSDIKLLKGMVSGGLTKEEYGEAIDIAYSKYTEEELKLVKSLYKKYMGKQ